MSESIVSLEDNIDVFSSICVSKFGLADVGTGAVKLYLVKTLVDFPNRFRFGSPCTCGCVPRFITTHKGVCTTGGS